MIDVSNESSNSAGAIAPKHPYSPTESSPPFTAVSVLGLVGGSFHKSGSSSSLSPSSQAPAANATSATTSSSLLPSMGAKTVRPDELSTVVESLLEMAADQETLSDQQRRSICQAVRILAATQRGEGALPPITPALMPLIEEVDDEVVAERKAALGEIQQQETKKKNLVSFEAADDPLPHSPLQQNSQHQQRNKNKSMRLLEGFKKSLSERTLHTMEAAKRRLWPTAMPSVDDQDQSQLTSSSSIASGEPIPVSTSACQLQKEACAMEYDQESHCCSPYPQHATMHRKISSGGLKLPVDDDSRCRIDDKCSSTGSHGTDSGPKPNRVLVSPGKSTRKKACPSNASVGSKQSCSSTESEMVASTKTTNHVVRMGGDKETSSTASNSQATSNRLAIQLNQDKTAVSTNSSGDISSSEHDQKSTSSGKSKSTSSSSSRKVAIIMQPSHPTCNPDRFSSVEPNGAGAETGKSSKSPRKALTRQYHSVRTLGSVGGTDDVSGANSPKRASTPKPRKASLARQYNSVKNLTVWQGTVDPMQTNTNGSTSNVDKSPRKTGMHHSLSMKNITVADANNFLDISHSPITATQTTPGAEAEPKSRKMLMRKYNSVKTITSSSEPSSFQNSTTTVDGVAASAGKIDVLSKSPRKSGMRHSGSVKNLKVSYETQPWANFVPMAGSSPQKNTPLMGSGVSPNNRSVAMRKCHSVKSLCTPNGVHPPDTTHSTKGNPVLLSPSRRKAMMCQFHSMRGLGENGTLRVKDDANGGSQTNRSVAPHPLSPTKPTLRKSKSGRSFENQGSPLRGNTARQPVTFAENLSTTNPQAPSIVEPFSPIKQGSVSVGNGRSDKSSHESPSKKSCDVHDRVPLGLGGQAKFDEFVSTLDILEYSHDHGLLSEPVNQPSAIQISNRTTKDELPVSGMNGVPPTDAGKPKNTREVKMGLHFTRQLSVRSATAKLWLNPTSHVSFEDSLGMLDQYCQEPGKSDPSSSNSVAQIDDQSTPRSVVNAPPVTQEPPSVDDARELFSATSSKSAVNVFQDALGDVKSKGSRSPLFSCSSVVSEKPSERNIHEHDKHVKEEKKGNQSLSENSVTSEKPSESSIHGKELNDSKEENSVRKNQSLSKYLQVHSPQKRRFDYNCIKEDLLNGVSSVFKEDKTSECSEASTLISGRSAGSFHLAGAAMKGGLLLSSRPTSCGSKSSAPFYSSEESFSSTSSTANESSSLNTKTQQSDDPDGAMSPSNRVEKSLHCDIHPIIRTMKMTSIHEDSPYLTTESQLKQKSVDDDDQSCASRTIDERSFVSIPEMFLDAMDDSVRSM